MGKKLNEKNEENEQRMRWRLKPANANNPHKRTQRRSARALVCNRRPALIAHLQECSMPGRKISSNHLGTHKASSAVAATEEMGAVRCIRNQSDISTICAVLCLSRFFRIFLLPFALEWFWVIAFFFFWCPDYMFSYIKMRSKKNPRRIAIFNFVWFIHEPYLIVLFFEFVFFFSILDTSALCLLLCPSYLCSRTKQKRRLKIIQSFLSVSGFQSFFWFLVFLAKRV